jgi:uncharacterized protein YbjT (DUF2867 family)
VTPLLVTGATGHVGGRLATELLERGAQVRALARDPARASELAERGVDVRRGDAVGGEGLDEALRGVAVAYYLIHSMGSRGDFAARDRRAAANLGAAAARAGVRRIVYLGGLEGASEHLASRGEVASVLAAHVPDVVHVRAAMIIGPGSASFEILTHLVRRLPLMITPRWLDTPTQPVAIGDVVTALAELADRDDVTGDVELGGADVLSYREMLLAHAEVTGRRRPRLIRWPLLSPGLSAYWIALVTPVPLSVVRPLVDGLRAETVVRTPPPAGLVDAPLGFAAAVRAAAAD